MTRLSINLRTALNRFFTTYCWRDSIYVGNNRNIEFERYNFNPVYLVFKDCKDDILEIPSSIDMAEVSNDLLTHQIDGYAIPYNVEETRNKRSADSMFKYFFGTGTTLYQWTLKKAVSNKGEEYYGAPGLLLDSAMRPIVLGFHRYQKQDGGGIRALCHVLKISPRVFTSEGLIEKAVIRRLIPYYLNNCPDAFEVKVEIGNIDFYIAKPNHPYNDCQEELKSIISSNKDMILDFL